MKNRYKIFIVLFVILFFVFGSFKDEEELRFRVIANSDSSSDQYVKNYLKNQILKEDLLDLPLNIIEEKCAYILSSFNLPYGCSVSIEKMDFNTKYYNDDIIKGGKYRTLVIRLGNASGKNYWTILYPEYYGFGFEDVSTGDVEYEFWIERFFK